MKDFPKIPDTEFKTRMQKFKEKMEKEKIERLTQYALRVKSDIEVIVQFGRMDITQDNLAYVGLMGFPG